MEVNGSSSSSRQELLGPKIVVPSWRLHSDPTNGSKYIVYDIKLQNGNLTSGVFRRYSDFISLRNWIIFILGERAEARVPQLPPKKVVFFQSSATALASSRAPLLAQFANRVIEAFPRLCLLSEFRDFFSLSRSDDGTLNLMRKFIAHATDAAAVADVVIDDIDPLPDSAPLVTIPMLISSSGSPISVMISINAAAGSLVRLIPPVPIVALASNSAKDPIVSTELFLKDFETKPQAHVESDGAGASFCIGPFELSALLEKGLHVHISPSVKQTGSQSPSGHFAILFWPRMFALENSGRVMSAIGYSVSNATTAEGSSTNVSTNFIWWPAATAKAPAATPACAAMPSDTLTSALLTQLSAIKKSPSSPLQRARSEIESLQSQLADAERALIRNEANYHEMVSKYQKRIDELQNIIAQAEKSRADLVEQHGAQLAEMMEKLRQYESQKDDLSAALNEKIAELEASLLTAETIRSHLVVSHAAQLKSIETSHDEMIQELKSREEAQRDELAAKLAAAESLQSALMQQHEQQLIAINGTNAAMIEKYEADLSAIRSKIEQMESYQQKTMEDYERKLFELEESKSALAKQHQLEFERWDASRTDLIAANEAQISMLEMKQRETAAQLIESHKNEVSELKETIAVLQCQLDDTREELSNLQETREKEINAALRRARASVAMENSQAALMASAQASFKRVNSSFSARSSASTTPLISPRRGDSLADALQKKLNALSGTATPSRRFSSTVIPPVSLSGLQTPSSASGVAKPAMPTVDAISLEPLVAATSAAVSALATSSSSSRIGFPSDFFLEDEYDDGMLKQAPKDVEDIE